MDIGEARLWRHQRGLEADIDKFLTQVVPFQDPMICVSDFACIRIGNVELGRLTLLSVFVVTDLEELP